MSNGINITVNSGPFRDYAPKPKGVTAVKLGEHNLDDVAKYIREALHYYYGRSDVPEVTSTNRYIAIGKLLKSPVDDALHGASGGFFPIGAWVLEEFDYRTGRVCFTRATLKQRKKYDLR